jgi:DNA-binding MarR family transcriptional regulator
VSSEPGGRQNNLVTLFLRAAHGMTDELVARLAAAGFANFRAAHGRVFENLDPHGTRLSDLAARAQMTHQSMSELVAGLESAGYVERVADPADGRARLICLTPLGRRVVRLAIAEIAKIEAAWFGQMTGVAGPDELRITLQGVIRERGSPVVAENHAVTNGVATSVRPERRRSRR